MDHKFLNDKLVYQKRRKHVFRQLLVAFSCHLQSICGGCIYGMSSTLLPQLEKSQEIVLNKDQQSWIASITTLMLISTALWTGFVLEKLGRRRHLTVAYILTITSFLTIHFANSYAVLMIGRAIGGIFIAHAYPGSVSFMGEVTHPGIRAACLAGVTLGCAKGVFLIQLMGIYLHWRTICLILLVMPVYNLLVMIYLKESYIWYINRGLLDEAQASFHWYRGGSPKAKAEYNKAILNVNKKSSSEDLNSVEKLRMCLSKKFLFPFALTCLLFWTSEFSGDIGIIFYTSHFLAMITKNEQIQFYSTLALNGLRVVATGCSCVFLKKSSVRFVWITSGSCVTFSLFMITLFLYLSKMYPENGTFPLVVVVFIIVNVTFFALGLGPLPVVICGELYPAPLRSLGSALSALSAFTCIFIIVKSLPLLMDSVDAYVIFLIFGVITSVGMIVSFFVLPNTKNKTLKELETFYNK